MKLNGSNTKRIRMSEVYCSKGCADVLFRAEVKKDKDVPLHIF